MLFGSRARGDHRPDSDFDLAFECAPELLQTGGEVFLCWFQEWKAELKELLGREVSLVYLEGHNNPELRENIRVQGREVYNKRV